VGVIAGERDRQIEAQAQIGEIVLTLSRRRVELRAPFQDLVDQLLVLAAAAPEEKFQVLQRRRLDPPKAIALVGGENRGRRAIPELHLGRKEILHPTRRGRVELHDHASTVPSAVGRTLGTTV